MIKKILQRLFVVYYKFLINLRKIKFLRKLNRLGIEDFSAVGLVIISEFFIVTFLLFTISLLFKISIGIPYLNSNYKFLVQCIIGVLIGGVIYFHYQYFLKNVQTKNVLINDFEKLPDSVKSFWKIFSFLLLLMPFWMLLFSGIKALLENIK